MIAYNKTWLANLRVQEKVKEDTDKGLLTIAEQQAIATRYPVGFYTPNFFVRVGLFILTCFIVSFGDGFISLAFISGGMPSVGAWFLFLGALTYGGLELMIYSKFHYRSGVDDALLIISAAQIGGGLIALLFDSQPTNFLVIAAIAFLLSLFLTLRFTDMLMAAVAGLSFLGFIFYLWLRAVPGGLATAPFAMMLVSGGMYWLSSKFVNNLTFVNYQVCLQVVQIIALLGFYASGNYYIIQTLSTEMAGRKGPVPFGAIFWVWTFAVPAVYLVFGLRKKEAMLLRLGLLLFAAAGFTFRAYYHLLPLEIMLTIIGSVILLTVYGTSRYLKTPKHGITADDMDEKRMIDKLRVESLAAAGSFAHAPEAPANDGFKYGGGSFGGGGSSSDY